MHFFKSCVTIIEHEYFSLMKAGLTERRLIQTNQPETAGEEDFMKLILGIILIVASLFLIIAVLMQSSKSHRLSGTIAGGAETFFGKSKGSTIDKKLSKPTTIVAIVFVVLVLVVYIIQPDYASSTFASSGDWKTKSIFSGAFKK